MFEKGTPRSAGTVAPASRKDGPLSAGQALIQTAKRITVLLFRLCIEITCENYLGSLMITTVLSYFLGILTSLAFSYLPNYTHIAIFFSVTLILTYIINFYNNGLAKLTLAFSIGLCWIFIYTNIVVAKKLPEELEGKLVCIVGYVASIPTATQFGTSFNFKILTLNNKKNHFLVHLSWQDKQINLHPGEKWRVWVKLKRLHSIRNPGTFDSEKQGLYQHIRAQGYVSTKQKNQLIKKTHHNFIAQIREYLQKKLQHSLKSSQFQGICLALVIGDTSFITPKQWTTFRNTGTSHLLAISGLHIGFFAGVVGKLMGVVWRITPKLPLLIPTPKFVAMMGMSVAFIYSALAGFSVSTQRSLIMISSLLSTRFVLQRNVNLTSSFLVALGLMTLINPLCILSLGFWLSFLAVGFLIYGCSFRLQVTKGWRGLLKPQWSVGLGMLPISLFFFQQYSLLSTIANVVAIPLISFFVIPPMLFGTLILLINETFGNYLFSIAKFFLTFAWQFLQLLAAHHEFILRKAIQNGWILLALTFCVLVLLMPRGMPSRWLALYWFLPMFFGMPAVLSSREVKLAVLDVGQGLAVLIRTHSHVMVYDTGAKITESFDMGKAVVIPYLIYANVRKLDVLMISHGDNDHIGGAASILKEIPVAKILTSVPNRFKHSLVPVIRCRQGMHWQWDDVNFAVLHPVSKLEHGNNASCVLKITSGRQSILLTGDIEKTAEKSLLASLKTVLPSTILVVPHHGSRTSSSRQFLQAVKPKYSLISCGYRNRYHHPHPMVCERYREIQSKLLNTTTSGAITMTLVPGSDIVVTEYRKEYHRFWHIF